MPKDPAIAPLIERLARLMRADEHSHGLNPAQWEALRYLARANRFSNSPGALTRYLGATKGTVSQTVQALVRKGFINKAARAGEKRSVVLAMTAAGEGLLQKDPWLRIAAAAGELGDKTQRRMARGARELLDGELKHGSHPSFGACATCRYFREDGMEDDPAGPHQCMAFTAPLADSETAKICMAHETAS